MKVARKSYNWRLTNYCHPEARVVSRAEGQLTCGELNCCRQCGGPSRQNTLFRMSRLATKLRYCDDHAGAGLDTAPAVAVLYSGIEIDGVFGLQKIFVAANLQRERSLEHIEKFDSGMLVRLELFRW